MGKTKKHDCPGDSLVKVIDFISKTDQEKMKIAKHLLYPLIRLLNIGLKYVAKKQTPYKYAVTQMVRKALRSTGEDGEYFIDFPKIFFSRGNLLKPQVEEVLFHDHKCEIKLNDNSGEGNARPDDISMLLFFNFIKQEFAYYLQGGTRSTPSYLYNLPASWDGDRVDVFICMYSTDKKLVADSQYLGEYIAG